MGPGCVKMCTSYECTEIIFSIISSRQFVGIIFVGLAKSRTTFYAQIKYRVFMQPWAWAAGRMSGWERPLWCRKATSPSPCGGDADAPTAVVAANLFRHLGARNPGGATLIPSVTGRGAATVEYFEV